MNCKLFPPFHLLGFESRHLKSVGNDPHQDAPTPVEVQKCSWQTQILFTRSHLLSLILRILYWQSPIVKTVTMSPNRRDVAFSTVDGITLKGWLFLAGEKKGPCIIMTPGVCPGITVHRSSLHLTQISLLILIY